MKNCFLLIFFFLSLVQSEAQSLDYFSVKGLKKFVHLADSSILIEDEKSVYNFKQILQSDTFNFQSPNSDIPYMDFTTSSYWMKINLKHDTNTTERLYLELARPLTNLVNLYVFNEENQLLKVFSAGDDLPFAARSYMHRKFIFPLRFPPNSKKKLIIQAKSDGEILKLPIKLWDVEEFTEFSSNENFALGFYYGFISLVVLLFSFFGFALRETIYFYFVS